MQSYGSASSRPSRDSLSSSHSFLLSEGDQTEDEADAFLSEGEGEGDGGAGAGPGRPSCTVSPEARSPPCSAFLGGAQLKRDQAGRCQGAPRVRLPGREGDFAFARKCAELQGFIRPLLELLNGLKRGKYDRGLSSFQQSVAMDRIQRIVGVLQNPGMGERHLHTLLQVEMMLKLWFPQVTPPAPPASVTPPIPAVSAPRWRRDQLHIPVKKRRLSWRDVESPVQAAPACKRFQRETPEEGVASPAPESRFTGPDRQGMRCEKVEAQGEPRPAPVPSEEPGAWREGNVTAAPVTAQGSPVTQEPVISSTTPLSPAPPPPPQHAPAPPAPCQSRPVATDTESGRGCESSRGRSQALPRSAKPFSAPEP